MLALHANMSAQLVGCLTSLKSSFYGGERRVDGCLRTADGSWKFFQPLVFERSRQPLPQKDKDES